MSSIPLRPVPILRALADAIDSAGPDQLPMATSSLFARARHRLPPDAHVTDDQLRDAACTVANVGLTCRFGEQWSRGPTRASADLVTTSLEHLWWQGRREREREGL